MPPPQITLLVAAILAAGSAFFFVEWLGTRSALRSMTKVERAQAQIAEDERRKQRRSPKQWFRDTLVEAGYRGDAAPVVLGLAFAYLSVAFVLTVLGVGSAVAMVLALPGVVGVAWAGRLTWWTKRRQAFAFQLKQLFDLLRGQLEAGYGTQRAMEMVVPSLPDPLRSEFQVALDSTRAGKDLISALEDVRQMYPSRGFDLFIAALEIDREQGGSLAGTLQRASAMLGREFALSEQASAELSQSKQTFYGVGSILLGITVMAVFGGDEQTRDLYFSFTGLAVLSTIAVLFISGVWRILKLLRGAGGEF